MRYGKNLSALIDESPYSASLPSFAFMPTYSPFLLATLIIVVIFIAAMKNGVVKILSGGIAAFFSIIVLFVTINVLPAMAEATIGITFTWKLTLIFAIVLAMINYAVIRLLVGVFVKAFFNPDRKFSKMVDGTSGGVISIFSSLVVVMFLFVCVRIIGTVQELNYITSLSQPGIEKASMVFPEWPASTQWRDSIEKAPLLSSILDLTEPFSRKENRNLAVLLIMKQSGFVSSFLNKRKEEGALINHPQVTVLSEDKAVSKALDRRDQLSLVLSSALQKTASNVLIKFDLQKLEIRALAEDFIETLPKPGDTDRAPPTD